MNRVGSRSRILLMLVAAHLPACAEGRAPKQTRWAAEWRAQVAAPAASAVSRLQLGGNWSGQLHPCECAAGMDGGVARAATLWRERGSLPIVIGSLLSSDDALRPSEIACVRSVLSDVGALGFGLSRRDLDETEAPADLGTAVPVSLNVAGARPFAVWREDGGGVGAWTHFSAPRADRVVSSDDAELLREAVAFLRTRAAYVLVTTDCQSGDLARVMDAARGCDLLVTAGRAGETSEPVVVSGARLMVLAPRGEAAIDVPRHGGAARRVALDASVPKDGPSWERVEEAFRAHARLGMARIDARSNAADEAAECATCHPAETENWRATGHARAWAALPETRRGDARCAACHAYPVASPGGGLQLRPDVGCPVCHVVPIGHGTERAADEVSLNLECARCHDAENSPDFRLTTALRTIGCRRRAGDSEWRDGR